ncbi:uncharacterized protein LOC143174889 [Nomia melanderi]|uniref:uncharacterized protein LOC143174889 n=1 Tax=Nomia melanderi TaxID=2448451 RepID=UPI003FCD3CEF
MQFYFDYRGYTRFFGMNCERIFPSKENEKKKRTLYEVPTSFNIDHPLKGLHNIVTTENDVYCRPPLAFGLPYWFPLIQESITEKRIFFIRCHDNDDLGQETKQFVKLLRT